MPAAIDFHFDFSSPYGYLASTRIEALAARHGRSVAWRPFLLGAVFKISGSAPLLDYPMKGDYARHDFQRFARLLGVPFNPPTGFPFAAVAASRAVYWAAEHAPTKLAPLVHAIFHAAYGEGRDVSPAETIAAIGATIGIERAELLAALGSPALKERLRAAVEDAIAKGVFGSPFIVVDGERFWGADRLDQIERWLTTGGW